jgi:hypothetical protein
MKLIYFFIITLFFGVLIFEHNNKGVFYNPLFHEEGGKSINSIAMPCGLGGSKNHNHK